MDTQKTGRGGQKKNDVPPRLFSGPCAAGADGAVPAKAVDHTRAGTELDDIGPVRRAGPAGQTVGGYRAVRAEPGYGPLTDRIGDAPGQVGAGVECAHPAVVTGGEKGPVRQNAENGGVGHRDSIEPAPLGEGFRAVVGIFPAMRTVPSVHSATTACSPAA